VVTRRRADRLRVGSVGLAADLRDERRRQRQASAHVPGDVQHEPGVVARRALDRLPDAARSPVRHLVDRPDR
jgi:hypothetical protein